MVKKIVPFLRLCSTQNRLASLPQATSARAAGRRYSHPATLSELQQEMLRLFRQTHPKADSIPTDLPLEQQLVRFSEPPDIGADLTAK